MKTVRPWIAAAMIASGLVAGPAAQRSGRDPVALPALALDSVPPAVRIPLQRAYDGARARPHDADAAGRLAMMLHAQEQYESAHAVYGQARQLAPTVFAWAYLGGVVEARLGRYAASAASLRQAAALDPSYMPARIGLADALMQSGNLEASRERYAALVRDHPELAVAHYGRGRASAMLGDGKDAIDHYRKAVEIAPQFGAAHYALALAYRDAGVVDLAQTHLEAYRRVGARRPVPPDALMDRVNAFRSSARDLIVEGARLEREGRLEASIALHLKALEADPAAAQAHVNLISLYGRRGEVEKAGEHYRAALTLQRDLADAHYNWGVLLASAGRVAEAADAFGRALEVNPFHAPAHNNLATLLAGQRKLAEAAAHYRQAISNDPGHRGARFNLGRVLVALGRPREAVEQFQRILTPEDDETPRYMHALATAWFAAHDVVKARECGERALRAARRLGQAELAARIERDLQRMKTP
ncbi:MAG: tetratricopeptide repeat protein [Vicinamibacterales bacterium]